MSQPKNTSKDTVARKPSRVGKTSARAVSRTPITKENTPKSGNVEESFTVRKSIQLNATPNEVWEALTNPEKTKKYFFNCEVHSDWKAGSPITFKGRMFFFWPVEMHGEIVKIEPQKLLKYTLVNKAEGSKPSSISTVTDQLTYTNGKTTLTISDDVGKGEGAKERYDRSTKGWDKILGGLKKILEK